MIRKWQSCLSERRPGNGAAPVPGRGRRGRDWAPEGLEDRVLLSGLTYTVDATTDTGAGSGTSGDLRYAITQANSNPGSTIQFGVSGTIVLGSAAAGHHRQHDDRWPGCVEPHGPGDRHHPGGWINGATVSISGLTIADGRVSQRLTGGGIYNNTAR